MILTGPQIESAVACGDITISPFFRKQLNPNSYDFRLGNRCCVYTRRTLDVRRPNKTRTIAITEEGLLIEPNRIYLINTEETMGSKRYVPIIRGRSSTGRLGLFRSEEHTSEF